MQWRFYICKLKYSSLPWYRVTRLYELIWKHDRKQNYTRKFYNLQSRSYVTRITLNFLEFQKYMLLLFCNSHQPKNVLYPVKKGGEMYTYVLNFEILALIVHSKVHNPFFSLCFWIYMYQFARLLSSMWQAILNAYKKSLQLNCYYMYMCT